jgi:hypothetical protein
MLRVSLDQWVYWLALVHVHVGSCGRTWTRGLMSATIWRILQKRTCLIALLVVVPVREIAVESINFPATNNHDHVIVRVASLSPSEVAAVSALTSLRENQFVASVFSSCYQNEKRETGHLCSSFRGSYSDHCTEYCPLGCDAVLCGRTLSTFRRYMLPPCSG